MAEVLGFKHDEALTLGRAVVGLNAYSKGVSLGLFQPTPKEIQEQRRKIRREETVAVELLHRAVPAKNTNEGLGGLSGESPSAPKACRNTWKASSVKLSKVFPMPCWSSRSLCLSHNLRKRPIPCTRNSGRKFFLGKEDGGLRQAGP